MNQAVQNELNLIKESVLNTVQAETIYLFGSYVDGTPSEDSDLDIYIVVPDMDIDLIETRAKIRRNLWKKQTMPLDLLIGKSSVFNRRKMGPTLERVIARKGMVIYAS